MGTAAFLSNKIGTIPTHEIAKLTIKYNKQRDRKLGYRHEPIHNGLICFDILYKDVKEKRLIILLDKKEQFNELGKVLKEYYKQKITIEELYIGNSKGIIDKTFLFKKHYLYTEKQELKAELQMEKFPI